MGQNQSKKKENNKKVKGKEKGKEITSSKIKQKSMEEKDKDYSAPGGPEEEKLNFQGFVEDSSFKFENRVWYWDARADPYKKGNPKWTAYDEVTSTVIERHFYEYS